MQELGNRVFVCIVVVFGGVPSLLYFYCLLSFICQERRGAFQFCIFYFWSIEMAKWAFELFGLFSIEAQVFCVDI